MQTSTLPAISQSNLVNKINNYPANLAETIPLQVQREIMKDLYDAFIFPQIQERRPYEAIWDKLLAMYRINIERDSLRLGKDDTKLEDRIIEVMKGSDRANVSDSLIFDAVDRQKNLCHFISWKDGPPVQYAVSPYYNSSKENELYHPLADKIQSANGLLQWNCSQQDVYRKHLILSGHHYLYGCSFVSSEYEYETRVLPKRKDGQIVQEEQLFRCGVTFEPISIRKLWLDYRVCSYDMDKQPCPFFYSEMSRFEVLGNKYDAARNPFGYSNLDKLQNPQYLFTQEEMGSLRDAIYKRLNVGTQSSSLGELKRPEFSMEAKWTFYPMLPLDPVTGAYKFDKGKPVPLSRFIVEVFGSNLRDGQIVPIRIQKEFYPSGKLPLYASCHMPDMDSGAYGLAIGEVLMGHYEQIATALNQWIDNKNLINNPPSWYIIGTPAATVDRNSPGADIPATSANDVGWRQVYDATSGTVGMLEYMRDRAQTTSKAVDAILGKAMGGRTSATEAQNAFQAAMSGVTTDINLFNFDIMGGYASRVWEITGLFFDEDLIKQVTGQYGTPLSLEDLANKIQIKWDVGSSFIESIVKQQHLRYALESATRSQSLKQDVLWRLFFKELKLPELATAVIDGGFSKQVTLATEQAIQTYLGEPITVNPAQNHQLAIEVKSAFIEDTSSEWNTQYAQAAYELPSIFSGQPITRAQALLEQIQIHQQFALIQMQQELAQQQMMAEQQQQGEPPGGPKSSGKVPENPGQVAQQQG